MSDTISLFVDAWKLMVGRLSSPQIEVDDGVATCFGNVPLLFLNLSIVSRPATDLEDLRTLLQTAARRAAGCTHASGVILREDWLPTGWEQSIQEEGLAPLLRMTGMEADELLAPRRPPANLEIRRAGDDATARDLAELNAHAYGMPTALFDCTANTRLWHADSFGFVGYDQRKPVSCAAAFPVAGTVYIALVATLPEAQGKGYAETVMRHAVTQGQNAMGAMRTTLHASDAGQPVYRAMGYKPGPRVLLVAQTN